jgi:organic radical activating enzyme
VFVRLAECNLACTWCDTKYTWDWANHDKARETAEVDVAGLRARVIELAGTHTRTVVVTGGEPMLQQEAIAALVTSLPGFDVEIETSGTIEPTAALASIVTRWNVSPKLETSGNKLTARLRTGPMMWFAAAPNATFKFVITSERDVDEVVQIAQRFGLPPGRIILMPEGQDPATLAARSTWLVDAARIRGYRFSTRLHVLLWGAERGR